MNFNQIAMLQKLKSSMDRFRNNHPKFPLFLKAVVGNALEEGPLWKSMSQLLKGRITVRI